MNLRKWVPEMVFSCYEHTSTGTAESESKSLFMDRAWTVSHEESSVGQTAVVKELSRFAGTYPRRHRVPIPQQGHLRSIAWRDRVPNRSGCIETRNSVLQRFSAFARQPLARKPK
jgi:hypothetical protein